MRTMEKQPLISIIVPFYNTGKYLKRCLDSIISQSYQNLEIILVNDGSEDDSAAIAENYAQADSRIRVYTQKNAGVSAARNAGLRKAAGEYVMFVDADDWIAAGSIERMMAVMQESEADLTTCNIRRVSDPSEAVPYEGGYTLCDRDEYMRVFFRIGSNEPIHYPVAKLYKRAMLPDGLYPEGIRIGEDVLGTYRAVADAERIARMNEVGYYYYYNPASVTEGFSEKNFDLITVWDNVVEASEGREPDHSYAVLNRKRINFGLLFLLATEVPAKERKEKYAEQESRLRADLKACEKDLMDLPIVRSRKILIFMCCHCYPLMTLIGGLYNKSGKKLAVGQRRNLS